MSSQQMVSSKITLVALSALLAYLGIAKFRQYQNQRQVEKQEQSLELQANALQSQNDKLSQQLQSVNSADYKEQVARELLGYKKQGEVVYGFSDAPATESQGQNSPAVTNNAQKWWSYFFGN